MTDAQAKPLSAEEIASYRKNVDAYEIGEHPEDWKPLWSNNFVRRLFVTIEALNADYGKLLEECNRWECTAKALTAKQEWDVEKVAEWFYKEVTDIDDAGEVAARKWAMNQAKRFAATFTPPSQGWRTMESAPKDGTSVLCFGLNYRDPVAFVAFWNGIEWYAGWGPSIQPTHWMPLPAPPTASQAQEPTND